MLRFADIFTYENLLFMLKGAGLSLFIATTTLTIGLVLGTLIAGIRVGKNTLLKIVATGYVEVVRGTPMLLQITIFYLALPYLYKVLSGNYLPVDPLVMGIIAIGLNSAAYLSEVIRAAINSIDKGQFEAAHAVGMSHRQTMFSIVLPQTIRNILPATGNEFVVNIKDTAVLNVISLNELFFASKSILGTTIKVYQTYLITCAIYLVLTFTTTRILRLIEKKLRGPDSYIILGSRDKRRQDMGLEVK